MAQKAGDRSDSRPAILIYSQRDRILNILALGLEQNGYRVLLARSSTTAAVKANQFLPDLVIVDITPRNIPDILLATRLRQGNRTGKIEILSIVPKTITESVKKLYQQKTTSKRGTNAAALQTIEYPFRFAELLQKIGSLAKGAPPRPPRPESNTGGPAGAHVAERLFDMRLPAEQKMEAVVATIDKQWAFPFTVVKAMDIMGDEASCCRELATCIGTDVSASAAVLKVANTVYYAKRQTRVRDAHEAVIRLGFRETRSLLSCLALIDLSPPTGGKSGFTRYEFWLHSLATGLLAEQLCIEAGFPRPEFAFTAGLVHDLAKVPLDNNFEQVFARLLEETANRITLYEETEKLYIGFGHSELGAYLAKLWNFPESIRLAILNHHNPDEIFAAGSKADRIVQEAVFVANCLAKAMNMGHSCDEILTEIPAPFLRELGIPEGPTEKFMAEIYKKITTLGEYLGLPVRLLPPLPAGTEQSREEVLFAHGAHPPFHPLLLSLRHNGYPVRCLEKVRGDTDGRARVIISMPDPGTLMDVVLYDDEHREHTGGNILKIFIRDRQYARGPSVEENCVESDMVFVDKENLDARVLVHQLDQFFKRP